MYCLLLGRESMEADAPYAHARSPACLKQGLVHVSAANGRTIECMQLEEDTHLSSSVSSCEKCDSMSSGYPICVAKGLSVTAICLRLASCVKSRIPWIAQILLCAKSRRVRLLSALSTFASTLHTIGRKATYSSPPNRHATRTCNYCSNRVQ